MLHKRSIQESNSDDDAPDEKRQRINFQRAVNPNTMQTFMAIFEPLLRRVVSEEMEQAISKYLPSKLRLPSKQLAGSGERSLRLQFQNKLALPLYTGSKVEGEHGNAIQVVLVDVVTGEVVMTGDEASAKLDIVVLEGDFAYDDEDNWTLEEFQAYEVKEREGKRPLLTGDLSVALKEGVGTLGELIFTDNSSWIRSRKFRLGVKMASVGTTESRVREAKSEAFFVKDHRGQLYKKHYPPALADEVWRLEKIGKDGAYHKRLVENHINTVEDFLVMYSTGPLKLREVFGNTMSAKTWDSIVEHAKTCTLNDTRHVYYPDDSHAIGVILNTIYQPWGIIRDGFHVASSSLTATEQVYMERLVQEAHNDLSSLCKLAVKTGYEGLEAGNDRHNSQTFQMVSHSKPVASQEDAFGKGYAAGGYSHSNSGEGTLLGMVPPQDRFMSRYNQGFGRHFPDSGNGLYDALAPNPFQGDTLMSTVGVNIQQPMVNAMFERLFASGQHYQEDMGPIGQDRVFNQPSMSASNDFGHGRVHASWGNDEIVILPSVNGVLTNSLVHADVLHPSPNFSMLHFRNRRAYMRWMKLRAVIYMYLYKNTMASKRRLRIKQLGC